MSHFEESNTLNNIEALILFVLLVCCLPVVNTLYYICEIWSAVFSGVFVGQRCKNNFAIHCQYDDLSSGSSDNALPTHDLNVEIFANHFIWYHFTVSVHFYPSVAMKDILLYRASV